MTARQEPEPVSGTPALARQGAILADLRTLAGELPREALAAFLGQLETVRVEILLAQAPMSWAPLPQEKPDRLLSVAETAERVGMSPWWIRQNKDALHAIVRLPGGRFKFSERRLESWLKRKAS
jgi:hypothetical protein